MSLTLGLSDVSRDSVEGVGFWPQHRCAVPFSLCPVWRRVMPTCLMTGEVSVAGLVAGGGWREFLSFSTVKLQFFPFVTNVLWWDTMKLCKYLVSPCTCKNLRIHGWYLQHWYNYYSGKYLRNVGFLFPWFLPHFLVVALLSLLLHVFIT